MAINSRYMLSQSFAASASIQLPQAPVLTGAAYSAGGANTFDVGQFDSYSFHIYLTGSGTGNLYHRVSNNCYGFAPYQSQSFAGNIAQDVVFGVLTNFTNYAQLYWSGSGAGQLTASVSLYGRTIGGRNR